MMFSNAEAYERFMGRWSRVVAPLLVDFAGVPAAGRILDVGSGIGTLAFEIAKRNAAQVTGIDPSREFVAYSRKMNPFPDRASFYVADVHGLPFKDAAFAAGYSLLVFNFLADAKKSLQEVRRVTQPAAGITAAVWDYGDVMGMLRTFWNAAADVDARAESLDEKHMPLCRQGELSQLWKQVGLENVNEQSLDITMRFDSFADYWEPFLLGQGPAGAYLKTVPPDRLQLLRRAVEARLPLSSLNDAFILPARVWAVRGTVP